MNPALPDAVNDADVHPKQSVPSALPDVVVPVHAPVGVTNRPFAVRFTGASNCPSVRSAKPFAITVPVTSLYCPAVGVNR